MKNIEIVFGRREALTLLITMISTKCVLYFPRTMAEDAATAGWIEALFISFTALVVFWIITKLHEKFEGMDIIDIGGKALGPFGRVAAGLTFLVLLLFLIPLALREFGEEMKVMGLNISPISFVILFFIAGMISAAFLGIEPIVRFQSITVIIVVVSFVLYLLMLAPHYDFTALTPILGSGVGDITFKGFLRLSDYAELSFLLLLAPFIKTKDNFKWAGYWAVAFNAFFMTSVTMANLLSIPYPSTREIFLPVFEMGRMIEYGRFFQRIESVFVTTWSLVGLMYLSTGFYLILLVFKKTFKLEYSRPLILPFIIIVFTLGLVPNSLNVTMMLETQFVRKWAFIPAFFVPILIMFIAVLRKKQTKKKTA